jgi:hypothetical protein
MAVSCRGRSGALLSAGLHGGQRTGFFEMQALYDGLLRYDNFKRYDEASSPLCKEDGQFRA